MKHEIAVDELPSTVPHGRDLLNLHWFQNIDPYMGPQVEGRNAGAVEGCTLRFDRKHQVLLITFGKLATQASALATYSAVERFVVAGRPCSVIADLSLLEKVEVPGHFVRSMAWMPLVIPAGKQRVIVAPRAAVYGLARMFQLYRDAMSNDVHVVHTLEEAHTLLGLDSPDFETVDPKWAATIRRGVVADSHARLAAIKTVGWE